MAHELLFINLIYHSGINVTVRRGGEWYELAIGDSVILHHVSEAGKTYANERTGVIIGLAILPQILIPEGWLFLEHDPACSNQVGLTEAMKRAYGDGYSPEEIVTVILFRVEDECQRNI